METEMDITRNSRGRSVKQVLCFLKKALAERAFLPVAEIGEFLELGFLR